jgi:hypothetical protein
LGECSAFASPIRESIGPSDPADQAPTVSHRAVAGGLRRRLSAAVRQCSTIIRTDLPRWRLRSLAHASIDALAHVLSAALDLGTPDRRTIMEQ